MEEIGNINSSKLTAAVRLWTGFGQSAMPNRNDKRLSDYFGKAVAAKLLPLIKSLEEDFYSSNARLVAANLQEMEEMASEHFRQKHPTVAMDIVKAFAWCYTFDFK